MRVRCGLGDGLQKRTGLVERLVTLGQRLGRGRQGESLREVHLEDVAGRDVLDADVGLAVGAAAAVVGVSGEPLIRFRTPYLGFRDSRS